MALKPSDSKSYNKVEIEFQGHIMLRRFTCHFDDMALAIVIWMCALPLVGLLILPFFGLKISLLVSAGLLIAILAICWGICSWKIFHS